MALAHILRISFSSGNQRIAEKSNWVCYVWDFLHNGWS